MDNEQTEAVIAPMRLSALGGVRAPDVASERVRTYDVLRAEVPGAFERCSWDLAPRDPWFYVVRELVRYVEWRCQEAEMHDTGWRLRVSQVKEKFGGLRFYYDMSVDEKARSGDARALAECEGAIAFAEWLCQREPW